VGEAVNEKPVILYMVTGDEKMKKGTSLEHIIKRKKWQKNRLTAKSNSSITWRGTQGDTWINY